MKKAMVFFLPLFLAYLSVDLGFLFLQDKLVFHPVTVTRDTPKKYSLNYKDVSFPSSDGTTLTGWWIQHPNSKGPVLLYCHGNADDLSMLAEVSRLFYDYGFNVLLFDYRSYGKSQKAEGELTEGLLDADAFAAYGWLKARGIPENHILIWGHSLGSSVAAWLATQTHPAGLILEGAFPSIYAVSRDRYPWLFVVPAMVRNKFPTEDYVAQRTCPLLEIHAQRDTIIPLGLGQRVFQTASDPKQWLLVEDINHNDFPSVAVRYRVPIWTFVENCLRKK